MKTLIVVHVATSSGTMPDGTPWAYDATAYDDMAIGTGTALGRIFHALVLAQACKNARLYITLPPDELPKGDDFVPLMVRAGERLLLHKDELAATYGVDAGMLLADLANAVIDNWDTAAELGHKLNTAGEAVRAEAYAVAHGYRFIQPVSTGWGHAARCGTTDFAQVENSGSGVLVAGYATTTFPELGKRQIAMLDPNHVKHAPAYQGPEATFFDLLAPTMFGAFGADHEKFTRVRAKFAQALVDEGIRFNARGDSLLPYTQAGE